MLIQSQYLTQTCVTVMGVKFIAATTSAELNTELAVMMNNNLSEVVAELPASILINTTTENLTHMFDAVGDSILPLVEPLASLILTIELGSSSYSKVLKLLKE